VGYEEGDPSVTLEMKCGYPRFVYHPYVLQLMDVVVQQHSPKMDCLVLPSAAAAKRCQAFLQQALEGKVVPDNAWIYASLEDLATTTTTTSTTTTTTNIQVVSLGAQNIHAVLFPAQTAWGMEAKAYWQHTGEVVSSRRAERALHDLGIPLRKKVTSCGSQHHAAACPSTTPHKTLQQQLSQWTQVPTDHIFLTPSGMSSIYHSLRSARRYAQQCKQTNGRSIVYGFPYLDTLKLCSRPELCPAGTEFFGYGNAADLHSLRQYLSQYGPQVAALLTEVPSNPLLQCPDVYALRELANEYNFCLIMDDTIANFLNVDLLQTGLADAVCTSLTKLVSGRGDAMAGSIVCNPNTAQGQWMQQDLQQHHSNDDLFVADAYAISQNAQDFVQRNQQINTTAGALTEYLRQHPAVQTIYAPDASPHYQQLRSSEHANGGLFSMMLSSHMCQRTFFDALDVAKGPSLGTNFTLVCPYTLLAHYHELEFATQYHVPPNLLRCSVGLESFDVLREKWDQAFATSQLYPRVKV
jgi:cystathionine gamma-synthase